MKLIPVPVMIGFCNGLALVIGLAQISNFKELGRGLRFFFFFFGGGRWFLVFFSFGGGEVVFRREKTFF